MSEKGGMWSLGKPPRIFDILSSTYTYTQTQRLITHPLLLQNYSSWSLLCREEGTWFLAGIRDFSSGCLRPRAFYPLQTHGPWISHVTRGAYLEDQLTWDWGPEGEETETQICPLHTEHGGEEQASGA